MPRIKNLYRVIKIEVVKCDPTHVDKCVEHFGILENGKRVSFGISGRIQKRKKRLAHSGYAYSVVEDGYEDWFFVSRKRAMEWKMRGII